MLFAYSMSKHAVEAFADSLAAQMAPLGVLVSIVEPGNFDSEIGKSAAKRTGKDNRMADRSKYKKPDEVAAAVELALFDADSEAPLHGDARSARSGNHDPQTDRAAGAAQRRPAVQLMNAMRW